MKIDHRCSMFWTSEEQAYPVVRQLRVGQLEDLLKEPVEHMNLTPNRHMAN